MKPATQAGIGKIPQIFRAEKLTLKTSVNLTVEGRIMTAMLTQVVLE